MREQMKPLLYLVHRIPYPPNKGDKIRSYHLLRYLSKQYRVYLGTFIDNSDDWQFVDNVQSFCEEVFCRPLKPGAAKIRSAMGFLSNTALTLPYYQDSHMQSWVNESVARNGINNCVVFSSSMAQYVSGKRFHTMHRIIDFVDIDSDKWLQYSKSKSWPMNWLWRRESRCLLKYEALIANEFEASFFVSRSEAEMFQKLVPQLRDKIRHCNNGVDTSFFSPEEEYADPFGGAKNIIVFTGAMDYWANVDAVNWFAKEVFPKVCSKIENAQFFIVGSNPTESVIQLRKEKGVIVTGFVQDVRPFLAYANIVVAPLRIARGIQNKVLEAMAMAKPIIVSPAAMEGIDLCPEFNPYMSNDPAKFAELCVKLLRSPDSTDMATIGRDCILSNYSWNNTFSAMGDVLNTN